MFRWETQLPLTLQRVSIAKRIMSTGTLVEIMAFELRGATTLAEGGPELRSAGTQTRIARVSSTLNYIMKLIILKTLLSSGKDSFRLCMQLCSDFNFLCF